MAELCKSLKILGQRIKKLHSNTKKSKSRFTKSYLETRYETLAEYWAAYLKQFEELVIKLSPKELEEIKDNPLAEYDQLEEEYLEFKTMLKDSLKEYEITDKPALETSQSLPVCAEQITRKTRLPYISIKRFAGDYNEWLSFRDIFVSLIHRDDTLTPVEKHHYLRSNISGEAEALLKHFTITAANYNKAWEALERRYNNKRIIVSNILNRLMAQKKLVNECSKALKEVLDTTQECLNSLNNLGIETSSWDPIIIHLVVSKLDLETHKLWEQSLGSSQEVPTFTSLAAFLESRFRAMEIVNNNRKEVPRREISKQTQQHFNKSTPLKTLVAEVNSVCTYCKQNHYICHCTDFKALEIPQRHAFVKKNNICFNCLVQGHSVTHCRQTINCRKCGRRHHTLLHLTSSPATSSPEENKSPETHEAVSMKIENQTGQVILPTAQIMVYAHDGTTHQLRALVDHGSQACLITEEVAQLLKLERVAVHGKITGISTEHEITTKSIVNLKFHSIYDETHIMVTKAYVLKRLTSLLPSQELVMDDSWPLLKSLKLADPYFGKPNHIDILLGADMHAQLIIDGLHRHNSLIALNSRLGWLISGQVTEETRSTHQVVVTHLKLELDQLLRKFWEIEENLPSFKPLSPLEKQCEEHFTRTHSRTNEGRYIVKLPFKEVPPTNLGDSRMIALRRLQQMEKRFARRPDFKEQYNNFMKEYLSHGHMQLVSPEDLQATATKQKYYLPHHAVLRESSLTTKLRVVFDGSAAPDRGNSLNDELLIGPPLQQDVRKLITKWRQHKIGLITDIQRMFRQILISPEDADYQRILWRASPLDHVQEYRLLTVTYGTSCAPFLAIRTMHQLAEDEQADFPEETKILKHEVYTDDVMTGESSEEKAVLLQKRLTALLQRGGFTAHKWASNSSVVLNQISDGHKVNSETVNLKVEDSIKTLGIVWNSNTDNFELTVKLECNSEIITKRNVLSVIAKTFDPLGWLAPVIIVLKIFMQRLWLAGLDWDEQLPPDLKAEWVSFLNDFTPPQTIQFPRWLGILPTTTKIELHGFSDASCAAYAGVVYLRVWDGDHVKVLLIFSKARVAPVRQVSLPRLELCGAVLLAKMLNCLKSLFNVNDENIFAWTDSTIVLAWLRKTPSTWTTFVANRTAEILTVTNNSQWHHIDSANNSADIATRGLTPTNLKQSELWWNGPRFLHENSHTITSQYELPETEIERKIKIKTHVCAIDKTDIETYINKYSKLSKLLRLIGYCLKFIKKCKPKNSSSQDNPVVSYLTANELQLALNICIRWSQTLHFQDEINELSNNKCVHKSSKLYSLSPYLDKNNILRVGGRLANADVSDYLKSPVILSHHCSFSRLIVLDAHTKTLHGGQQLTLNCVRQKYFIIRVKNLVKSVLHKCITCFKYLAQPHAPLMANLPSCRVKPDKVFNSSGVDFCGPFTLKLYPGRCKKTTKAYVCLFVCMVSKALHLELVSDLTSAAFIAAFKRFTSRRGHCQNIWSDCGTNFVGASKELDVTFKNAKSHVVAEIAELLANDSVQWHFIPPSSPNFGGLWEAGVKSVKGHLKRVIGQSCLTFEEFATLLTQVEACVNSRPLTLLNSSPDEPPLTPGHFLTGGPLVPVPDEPLLDVKLGPLERWRIIQQHVQCLWQRWQQEYLTSLQNRYKWAKSQPDIELGTVVLVKDNRLPPGKWLLGQVVEKHPGADGITRVVTLRYKNNFFKRPVNKLCPLPIHN